MILFCNRIIQTMSLYVHPQNQEMLWTVMNKVPIVTQFFDSFPPAQKEQWFKSVIQMFYDRSGNRTMNAIELQQLNQDTISYIINTVQEKTKPIRDAPVPLYTPQPAPTSHIFKTSAQEKQEALDKQFASREKEYHSIFDRPLPPTPNFSEKIEDTAISNMDELIRQQRQLREQELRQYAPQPPLTGHVPATPITIDPNPSPVNIRAEILEHDDNPPAKKTVTFKQDNSAYDEILQLHANEITEMKNIVVRLADSIGTLAKDVLYIKQHIDASALSQYS
jgi:hypothetical protein